MSSNAETHSNKKKKNLRHLSKSFSQIPPHTGPTHWSCSCFLNSCETTENNMLFVLCVGIGWVTTIHLTLFNPFFHITPERIAEVGLKGWETNSGEAIYYLERGLSGNHDILLSSGSEQVGLQTWEQQGKQTWWKQFNGRKCRTANLCVCVCTVDTPALPTTLLSHRARGHLEEPDTCKSNMVHQTPQHTEVTVRNTNKTHCFFD